MMIKKVMFIVQLLLFIPFPFHNTLCNYFSGMVSTRLVPEQHKYVRVLLSPVELLSPVSSPWGTSDYLVDTSSSKQRGVGATELFLIIGAIIVFVLAGVWLFHMVCRGKLKTVNVDWEKTRLNRKRHIRRDLHPRMGFMMSRSDFTFKELSMATNGFSRENLLGQGGFGYVYKGVLPDGKVVAVKKLKAGSGQGEREFQAEVEVISRVHHRHLVSLVGYCISGYQRMLVYEFVPNGTLEFHLHGKGKPAMKWEMRMKMALGSAKGLAYLHEDCHPKIIHRDIKAANILLDMEFKAKVADFGLAKFSSDTETHVSTRIMGTFGYLAPEYACTGKLTDKSDVFSFGVMLLELITGRYPIDKNNPSDESLVEWAKPLLKQATKTGNFDDLVDPKLQGDYKSNEMNRMVACAAASVRNSARLRPQMSQIARALEGIVPLDELSEGVQPGNSTVYSFQESGNYNTQDYKQDLENFGKLLTIESQDHTSGESNVPSISEFGLNTP